MTNEHDDIDVTVFSLVCEICDAGDDMLNEVDARAAGWTAIEHCTDLPMANYLGLCPDCRREQELTERIEQHEIERRH
jgi:hypothetical protein